MKKKIIFTLTLAMLMTGVFSACASADPNRPKWAKDVPPHGVIWGIGSARQATESLSRTFAETRARVSIARQMGGTVKLMFNGIDEKTGQALEEHFSVMLTSVTLGGTRTLQRWQAPDGAEWCLMEYNKVEAKKLLEDFLDSDAVRVTGVNVEKALKTLDAELAKKTKPILITQ
ncbi:hypothetical protein AGMMS49928_13350 [Spirochaetia bacterium]|nr:hypothetical protein AGMMS49928_13350 [Spirochaetia bacterium]